jgi:alpha-galactosidase
MHPRFKKLSLAFSVLLPTIMSAFYLASSNAQSSASSLVQTPPMGWNSYNYFWIHPTDSIIRTAADQIVASGMKDAGYQYVIIDGGWEGFRDGSGILHPNSAFPDMKALADYVHSKGLKIGIYSSPGPTACGGFPGSYGFEQQDANTFAGWGFDYLKYDLCSFQTIMQTQFPNDYPAQMKLMIVAYDKMSKALRATGRPFVFSLCQYGLNSVWEWGESVGGNLWRTTFDIAPYWYFIAFNGFSQAGLGAYAGPGHWNDPDVLEVGNGNLTLAEDRSHFSLWAILAAPLIAGNNLSTMTPDVASILTNHDVIAIDQDSRGESGTRAYAEGEVEIWTRRLANNGLAICIINNGTDRYSSNPFHLNLRKLPRRLWDRDRPLRGKDLWSGKEITLTDGMPIELGSHDVLLARVDRTE